MMGRNWFRDIFRRQGDPGDRRRVLGRRGEQLAARHLRRAGYRILHRNLRVGDDEADIVAMAPDGRMVVIVEVKTRRDDRLAPELAVNQQKQSRLVRLAARLQRRRAFTDRAFRFDVIAITWPEAGLPELRHLEGAFQASI